MASVHKGIVLVADDDEDTRHTLEELLENEGYIVLSARDGQEALARMRGISRCVVALVDLMMPGMDGRTLIERMKADQALRQVPIVVITAWGSVAVGGADVVMSKPLSPTKLLKTVEQYCR